MRTTRRRFVQGTLAATALTGAPRHRPRADAVARAHHPRRDAGRPALARPDLDHREHHRLSRRDDLRHAVRARRRPAHAAADGRQIRRLRRQAHPYLRAARRAEIPRRLGRHRRRRGRLDPPLGGARRRRPAHDAAREGHLEEGRQDLRDRAEGALRPRHRPDGEDRDADALHHAQEGSRDRSEPADHRIHRLRPVHLQSRRDPDGLSATSTTAIRTTCRAPSPRPAWPARRRSPRSTASSTRTCRTRRPRCRR